MLELLNVRFSYSLRISHLRKDGKSAIVLRVVFRGDRRDIFTGLCCFQKDWEAAEGRVAKTDKGAATVNQNLAMILKSANNSFDEMKFSREAFTIDDLMDKIRGKEEKPTLLIDYLKEGNRAMAKRVGSEIVLPTYNKYNRSLLYMQEFLEAEYKVKKFTLQKLSVDFLRNIFNYFAQRKVLAIIQQSSTWFVLKRSYLLLFVLASLSKILFLD